MPLRYFCTFKLSLRCCQNVFEYQVVRLYISITKIRLVVKKKLLTYIFWNILKYKFYNSYVSILLSCCEFFIFWCIWRWFSKKILKKNFSLFSFVLVIVASRGVKKSRILDIGDNQFFFCNKFSKKKIFEKGKRFRKIYILYQKNIAFK